ncbi:hypothetical protein [Allostreptomyces psammosilenae]|uniref:CopG family transcriptional regulator n=1 Tax=Allostreptomyces psammosilenae TaxID=1892865 RepID=A0A853A296_9ACTN|nr:hypothetical protein [Allostreptomyces psammosilenae]NYI08237.1 hypothetical protein [Allostreptomyces psammosilenae]
MTTTEDDYAVGTGPATVISVSMPKGTATALRNHVGKRGISAFVTELVEDELRAAVIDEVVASHVREHGPFPQDVIDHVDADFDFDQTGDRTESHDRRAS